MTKPTQVKDCPFDAADHGTRKYYMMAGGRIEFQNKADGSTMRILANPDGGKAFRMSNMMFDCDGFTEKMANHLHTCIEQYVAEEVAKATAWRTDLKNMPMGSTFLIYKKHGTILDVVRAVEDGFINSDMYPVYTVFNPVPIHVNDIMGWMEKPAPPTEQEG